MDNFTKAHLKDHSRYSFSNNHKDSKTLECLIRIVKSENGTNMARWGWQLIDSIVNEVIDELTIELNVKDAEPLDKCEFCGSTDGVTKSIDPYQHEMNDDDTEYFMCPDCYEDKLGNI